MTLGCEDAFVALAALQWAPMVKFYSRVLDNSPAVHSVDRYAEFRLPGLRLGIFAPNVDHRDEFSQAQGSGLSLCLEVKDLDGAIAHLVQAGYAPTTAPTVASHGREVYVYDPDGNRLILHEARPKSL